MSLTPHPLRRIVIPIVTGVRNPANRCLYVVPTTLIVKSALHELADEGAALAGACASIKFQDQRIRQCYVYSHVLSLAHN